MIGWCGLPHIFCLQGLSVVCCTIQKYRFIINSEKLLFVPTQKVQWLGLIWDTRNQSLSLPEAFQLKVQDSLLAFVQYKCITHRYLERVIGLHNFACVANPLGRLSHTRINSYLKQLA